ncbi:MAG: hypothetical protein ACOCV2_15060, partial [Persicimonas sp.]
FGGFVRVLLDEWGPGGPPGVSSISEVLADAGEYGTVVQESYEPGSYEPTLRYHVSQVRAIFEAALERLSEDLGKTSARRALNIWFASAVLSETNREIAGDLKISQATVNRRCGAARAEIRRVLNAEGWLDRKTA